jgi:hypothetical protein
MVIGLLIPLSNLEEQTYSSISLGARNQEKVICSREEVGREWNRVCGLLRYQLD